MTPKPVAWLFAVIIANAAHPRARLRILPASGPASVRRRPIAPGPGGGENP